MVNIYDVLLQIPLFQGLSKEQLSTLMGKTRFHFLKYSHGEYVTHENEMCSDIKFLISGSVRTVFTNSSRKISIAESINAPEVLAPDHLFGKSTYYPVSIRAEGDAGIMQLEKNVFLDIIQAEKIILLNFLNILSMRSQKLTESYLHLSPNDVKDRFAFWTLYFTHQKGFDIKIIGKQKDLYSFFGVQRSLFINTLDEMKESGIIDYSAREITLLDRSKLADYYRLRSTPIR